MTPRKAPEAVLVALAERFWPRVDKRGPDECWPWLLALNNHGYGHFHFGGKDYIASRVAFFIERGHWPEPMGLHSCDNRPCCNPRHIFEGTVKDNHDDMWSKGRSGSAKITREIVAAMRCIRALSGLSTVRLAKMFGVHNSTVSRALRGLLWPIADETVEP